MKEKLVLMLLREFDYSEYEAQLTAEDLLAMHPDLVRIMEEWLMTRVDPSVTVEGISTSYLIQERGYNPLSALLAMDWLMREPKRAKELLLRDGFK